MAPHCPALPPFEFPGAADRDQLPGAHGVPTPDRPVVAGGRTWDPADADVWTGSPIGLALALETAGDAA